MCDDDTMASYYADQDAIFGDLCADEPVWVTKDRRVIPIRKMEDSHLVNTIRMLRRTAERHQLADLSRMGRYIAKAPDGAAEACDLEAMWLADLPVDDYLARRLPAFVHMLHEARRRGVTL